MPFLALLLILAVLFPLASALALRAVGRRLGMPLAGYVAIVGIAAAFACSGWAMMRWLGGGSYLGQPYGKGIAPIGLTWHWVPLALWTRWFGPIPPGWVVGRVYIDSLAVALFVTLTFVAMLVHIFATRSLRRDPNAARFFAAMGLACFATLGLLLSGTLIQMVLLLELVGLAASMLIGFRPGDDLGRRAATRIFVIQRIGDVGFIIGLGILLHHVGNTSLPGVWLTIGSGTSGIPTGALTAAGIALFFGAASRLGQFPLHVWAGDVADGVAPAAATVLSLTLAAGGLYLIARLYPVFTPSARLLIAIIGTTTLIMAAAIATAQPDAKRSLAFVAASQLGLMVVGIGVGSWSGAMFHLISQAFAQVLLLLAAGSVIRATRGETELAPYGGLFSRMPVTAITSAIAALTVCGVGWHGIGLSGYFSRGLILRHAAAFASMARSSGRSGAYGAFFFFAAVSVPLVCFALGRWWMLTFAGPPRDRRLHEHAREVPALIWPLIVLGIMTILAGNWLGIRDMLDSSVYESTRAAMTQAESEPRSPIAAATARPFESTWPSVDSADEDTARDEPATAAVFDALNEGARRVSEWAWPLTALGILLALVLYFRGDRVARAITRVPPMSWIHAWLYHRMYFDELYGSLFVAPIVGILTGLRWVARTVFDFVFGFPTRNTGSASPDLRRR